MSALDVAGLLLAGFAASVVNAVAGGGSLITFPTLLATGLSPVAANVTNSLGVSPGYIASVFGSRVDLADVARRRGHRWLLALLPTTIAGAAAGCALLLATPARAFELVVPFLVLGATAALAFQRRLRALVGHPRDLHGRRRTVAVQTAVGLGAVYFGYFGAAGGVLMVAALGLVLDETLTHITALKNAHSAISGLTTVLAFSLFGPVDWLALTALVPATLAGGYAGARLARRLSAAFLRSLIVSIGTVVGLVLLVRLL